jgi:hypothetical protein
MPRQLEHRQRIGDLLAPAELERRPQSVAQREPQNAANHPFPQVIHRFGAYRRCPPGVLW